MKTKPKLKLKTKQPVEKRRKQKRRRASFEEANTALSYYEAISGCAR